MYRTIPIKLLVSRNEARNRRVHLSMFIVCQQLKKAEHQRCKIVGKMILFIDFIMNIYKHCYKLVSRIKEKIMQYLSYIRK